MRFFIILFLLCSTILSAQDTIWFDAEWNETTQQKAEFYRPNPSKIKKGYWVIDYYKNGAVKREGYAKHPKKKNEKFDGLVIEYHKTGKPSVKNNYKNGILQGVSKTYFETGELKSQTRYRKGKRDGVWKEFYKSGKIKTKGKYRDGEKVGVWKTYYKNVYEGLLLDY